jgi:hypothetical protein
VDASECQDAFAQQHCHIPEDLNHQTCCCGNLRPHGVCVSYLLHQPLDFKTFYVVSIDVTRADKVYVEGRMLV